LLCVEEKSGRIRPREVLGDHRRQSQQIRVELGLTVNGGFVRANGSGLLTHIATMEGVWFCVRMKS